MIRCARSMARTCRRINFAVLHFHGCATRVAQLGYLYRRRMSWRKSTGEPMAKIFTVYGNVEHQDFTLVSRHRSLAAAGRSYQAAHTGNLRRVMDEDGRDVTEAACDAANADYLRRGHR